ncbi:hypothetical protein V6N12_062885 [Hibiscus sabdariffa]|uniref:Uncharacterized protein n=1 Tax=Hibiscus sabdariffa TaxID=183260 RepID=A0ABR2FA72_9ROSI
MFGEPSAAGAVKECIVREGSAGHNDVLFDQLLDSDGLALTDVQRVSVVLAPELIVGSNVLIGISVQSVDDLNSVEFPTLQDSTKKKGRGRGNAGGNLPREADAGVANILLEMKAKKKDHVLKAKSLSEVFAVTVECVLITSSS